jgi:hypothetical protein
MKVYLKHWLIDLYASLSTCCWMVQFSLSHLYNFFEDLDGLCRAKFRTGNPANLFPTLKNKHHWFRVLLLSVIGILIMIALAILVIWFCFVINLTRQVRYLNGPFQLEPDI